MSVFCVALFCCCRERQCVCLCVWECCHCTVKQILQNAYKSHIKRRPDLFNFCNLVPLYIQFWFSWISYVNRFYKQFQYSIHILLNLWMHRGQETMTTTTLMPNSSSHSISFSSLNYERFFLPVSVFFSLSLALSRLMIESIALFVVVLLPSAVVHCVAAHCLALFAPLFNMYLI